MREKLGRGKKRPSHFVIELFCLLEQKVRFVFVFFFFLDYNYYYYKPRVLSFLSLYFVFPFWVGGKARLFKSFFSLFLPESTLHRFLSRVQYV